MTTEVIMSILPSGLTAKKTPPSTVPLAYRKKESDFLFQELHLKSVEAAGFQTPDHQIGDIGSKVVSAQL
jgi:hypothetical protein